MAAHVLSNGSVLVVRRDSIECAADLDLPGRARLLTGGKTVARGVEALRAAWPLLPTETKIAAKPKPQAAEPEPRVARDWSNATVADIATTQPGVLRRAQSDPHLLQVLAFRSAGDEIGWRSEGERLFDAGFPSFSMNRPSAKSEDGEDRSEFIGDEDGSPAPLEPVRAKAWGHEVVEMRWRENGPILRTGWVRGRLSTVENVFGPVSTLVYQDEQGRTRSLADVPPHKLAEAEDAIAKIGGTVLAVTERDRWYRRPVDAEVAASEQRRFVERYGSKPPAVRPRSQRPRLRRDEVVTPVTLRYDLVAEEAQALVEDTRGGFDETPEVVHALYWRTRRVIPAKYAVTRSGSVVLVRRERFEVTYRLLSGWLSEAEMEDLLADRPAEVLRRIWVRTEVRGPVADSASVAEFGSPIARTGGQSPVRSFLR